MVVNNTRVAFDIKKNPIADFELTSDDMIAVDFVVVVNFSQIFFLKKFRHLLYSSQAHTRS